MFTISIIISTYNSPQWLEKVLWGFQFQTDKKFQILVADDGSSSETRDIIQAYNDKFEQTIVHVWQEDLGFRKCAILNKAILAAKGDYLIFTDGDCVPRYDFVSAHRKNAKYNHFLSGTYCKLPMKTSRTLCYDTIRTRRAFSIYWLSRNGYKVRKSWAKFAGASVGIAGALNRFSPSTKQFHGNNSSVWRRDALKIGGFDERMSYGGEDHEFGFRLQNAGVIPKLVRYSALCLHLDHSHDYVDDSKHAQNREIIANTCSQRLMRTPFGIN
ncbi:MAG TPA: glycosyl transferase family 2 [Rhizobium sp.]|nr:glycosyl transferase family 2 [Rhizobium sp.]